MPAISEANGATASQNRVGSTGSGSGGVTSWGPLLRTLPTSGPDRPDLDRVHSRRRRRLQLRRPGRRRRPATPPSGRAAGSAASGRAPGPARRAPRWSRSLQVSTDLRTPADQSPANASGEPSRRGHVVRLARACRRGPTRTTRRPGPGSGGGRTTGANAGEVATVSARALIMRAPARRSAAHGGTRPQRARSSDAGRRPLRTAGPPAPDRWAPRSSSARSPRRRLTASKSSAQVGVAPGGGVPAAHASQRTRGGRGAVVPPMPASASVGAPANSPAANVGGPRQNESRDRPHPWTAPTATGPVTATVRLPGSKSMTARALVLSALADGPSTIDRPLRARDTTLMAAGLRALGSRVDTPSDDDRWPVEPGALRGPARIDVGLAGTVMRFLPPVAALAEGDVSPSTAIRARAHRPLRPIVDALRALGAVIEAGPAAAAAHRARHGGLVEGGEAVIDASGSSQFVSGLLLAAPRFTKGLVAAPRGSAGAVRAAPADDHAHAAGGRGPGRRERARRVDGRARPAARARLGHRARPVRRRAVLRRGRWSPAARSPLAGLAGGQLAARRPAAPSCSPRLGAEVTR